MTQSKIQELAQFGQSIWLDYISRPLIETGDLKELIDNGLKGMTSNPSIFNQAIGTTNDYDEKIIQLKNDNKSTFEIYDDLTIKDIQDAADQFLAVYEKSNKLDGYVSLEINPLLANKKEEQAKEGLRLFEKVNRPNIMIKVPATEEGFYVVEELIAQGVNVNTTLIFSLIQYLDTVEAYFQGLNRLAESGKDLKDVHSVASVFISRIDTAVDGLIEEGLKAENLAEEDRNTLNSLKGKAAVANSRLIFEKFDELFTSDEFKELEAKGANKQRCLWGSTGTKNPDYSDIKYVTELIASPSVNTLPEKTLKAFLDHGEIQGAFVDDVSKSREILSQLLEFNVNIDQVCRDLLAKGLTAFDDAFVELQESLEKKAQSLTVTK